MSQISPAFNEAGVSPMGGFWTDEETAGGQLLKLSDGGAITSEERDALNQFIVEGYAILPKAVPDSLIEQVEASLAGMFEGQFARRMSYWDAEGHHIEPASEGKMMNDEAKLLDIHYVSEGAQSAIFAPKVKRFLELVFQEPTMAFQSLYFKRGSEQGIHQDTAFVPVQDAPLSFAASWIALEDVEEGTGELLYVPHSHRLPHLQFQNGKKCMPDDPRIDQYEQIVRDHYTSANLKPQGFLPKKGDVLIWSADLCHGGAPITKRGRTRRSLVTHYCPASLRPEYAAHVDCPIKETKSGGYVISS